MTIVEFSEKHIRLRQGGPPNTSLIHVSEREVLPMSDQEISGHIREMIKESQRKPGIVVGSIPRRLAMMRQISLPSHVERELRQMVELEVGRLVPYPKAEIVWDYVVLEKRAGGYSKILLVVIHQQWIRKYAQLLTQAGLIPSQITLSSEGLAAYSHHDRNSPGPAAILAMESSHSEMCFCQEGKLLFSRPIPWGVRDLSQGPHIDFMKEIVLTLKTYQREEMGDPINKLIIVSQEMPAPSFQNQLTSELNLPVEIVNSKESLDEPPSHKFNLLKGETKSILDKRLQNKEMVFAGCLLMVLLLANVVKSELVVLKNSLVLQKIHQELEQSQPAAQEIERKIDQMNFLRRKTGQALPALDYLEEIYRQAPPEVSFNLFNVSGNSFVLEGIARIGDSLNVFQGNLAGSALFKDVALEFATKRKTSNDEMTFFKIKGQVTK